jgi:hypothetical protein
MVVIFAMATVTVFVAVAIPIVVGTVVATRS